MPAAYGVLIMDDLEATQDIKNPDPPKEKKIVPFSGVPYRVVPEVVIRQALAYLDKIEDIVVVFRLKGTPGLVMNYNTDIMATDLLIASSTMSQLAYQRMGLAAPFQLPISDAPDPETPS